MASIGIVQWFPLDGITDTFEYELLKMGHQPVRFLHTDPIPGQLDMVLTFAPYDRFFPVAKKIGKIPKIIRPVFIHWASENVPDPRIPKPITLLIARLRVIADRTQDSSNLVIRRIAAAFPMKMVNRRIHRFRHIADYRDAYKKGWLHILADVSALYTAYHNKYGIPAIYVPWGTSTLWYKDLNLPRDIGVLWMGKRRTRQRSQLIDRIEKELKRAGIEMYIADGEKKPLIYHKERIEIINRSLITVNIQYIPYIVTLPLRFGVVAGNKSMVLAEEMPNHSPDILPGEHYITSPRNEIIEKIFYYLENDQERKRITEKAFILATTQLTMQKSLSRLIDEAYAYG